MERTLLENKPTIEGLSDQLHELDRRIAALESRAEPAPQSSVIAADAAPALDTPRMPSITGGMLLAIGKALLAFAGAYLIRAAAESGTAPQLLAVMAALVYAVCWLAWSARIGLSDRFSMSLYGLTAALIVSAMLWETTVHLQVLSPALSAASAALFTGAGLWLAWPRNLSAVAWIATLAGVATSLVLLIATRDLFPFIIVLLVIAASIEYATCRGRSPGQRWLTAVAADFSIFSLTFVMSRPQGLPESYHAISILNVILLQAALVLIYVFSIGYRTLAQGLDITPFEIGQTIVAVLLLLYGAVMVVHAGAGAFCLAAGMACYLTSIAVLRYKERQRNFYVYMTFGLAFLLFANWMLLSGFPLAAMCSALALGAMVAGRYMRRISIQMNAPAYLLAASLASGLIDFGNRSIFATSGSYPATGFLPIVVTAFVAGLCYAASGRGNSIPERIPPAIAAAVLCWSALAFAAAGITAALGAGGVPHPAISATLRTGLLCGLAILLALAASRWGRQEFLWLVYPLMLLGACKLLLQDFPQGQPATIALSLLFYGGTLLSLPKVGQAFHVPTSPKLFLQTPNESDKVIETGAGD